MAAIRRLIIDVLKPHEPTMLEFARHVSESDAISGVNATLIELDQDVQNVKLTIEGESLEYDDVEATIEDFGGTVHSIDQVVCGEHVVENNPTPQD